MQIKDLIEKCPGNGDFSCEFPMVITKLKIVAEHLSVGTEDEFEAGKCDQCDRIATEMWALQDMLENCIDDLEHIDAHTLYRRKTGLDSITAC